MNREIEFDFETTFPPLGHPEHHFTKYPNHPWLRTEEEIKDWLKNNDSVKDNLGHYIINDDFTVSLPDRNVVLYNMHLNCIPVQFRICDSFNCYGNSKLRSLIGTPYNCVNLRASNTGVESLVGISKNIYRLQMHSNSNLKGFTGMPKNNKWYQLDIQDNQIESWEGFTNCGELCWWQDEWCDKTSLNFLLDTPEGVGAIHFYKAKKYFQSDNSGNLNMEFIRNEQKKIKLINNNKESINNSLNFDKLEQSKKRKL